MTENIETPKRKRRTKAEMEAARAAGEAPAKRTKKKVEHTTKTVDNACKRDKNADPMKSVLIMACMEPNLSSEIISLAKDRGIEVVTLEDKVISDYLKAKKSENKTSLEDFLSNTSNRLAAEEKAVYLYELLTSGGAEVENSEDYVFSKDDITKRTNLSHSQASGLMTLLNTFGLLEYVSGKGSPKFILHFDKKRQHLTIQKEVLALSCSLSADILRYKKSIDSDSELTEQQRGELMAMLKQSVIESI